MLLEFTCNGRPVSLEAEGSMRALDLLRDRLGLTGTKEGCGRGECGACTILLDGRAVNSCLLYAAKLKGRSVVTIEGLGGPGGLDPLQEAFLEAGAVQCGYCTPGMILSAKALLDREPDPTDGQIEEALSGNLCRCTGYAKILTAVRRSAVRRSAVRRSAVRRSADGRAAARPGEAPPEEDPPGEPPSGEPDTGEARP